MTTPRQTRQTATDPQSFISRNAAAARSASSAPRARVRASIARWAPWARPMGRTAWSAKLASIQGTRQWMTPAPGGQTMASVIAQTQRQTGQTATGARNYRWKRARIARAASSAPRARVRASIARWEPRSRPMGRTASRAKLASIQATRQWMTRAGEGQTTASVIAQTQRQTGQTATGARNYRWKRARIARAAHSVPALARLHAKIALWAL